MSDPRNWGDEIEPPDPIERVRVVRRSNGRGSDWGDCVLCDEPIGAMDAWRPLNEAQLVHHECGLREVIGGIGHQLAHDYWCMDKRDPDAGLTYRQSARMVATLAEVIGIDAVIERSFVAPERQEPHRE